MKTISTSNKPHAQTGLQKVRGAVAHSLLVLGIVAAVGALGGGAIWLLTGAVAPALQFATRIVLFGAILTGAFALCHWLCGDTFDQLTFKLEFGKGDFGTFGVFVGIILAGYLAPYVLAAKSEDRQSLAIGKAVEIAGPTLDGGHFDLADHRGKVVLVDFWATWCGPCVAELPHVREAYDQYHGQGLNVVSVSLDFQRSALVKFLETNPVPWPQIFFDGADRDGWENPLARRYGIQAIPCLLVLDREGKLVARDVRGKQIATAVGEALGQPMSWTDRIAGGALQVLGWFFYGMMVAPAWLVILCGLGIATLTGLAEATVRRSFAGKMQREAKATA